MSFSFFRKNNPSFQALLIVIFLSLVVSYKDVPSFFFKVKNKSLKILKSEKIENNSIVNFSTKPFEEVSLKAKAYVVYDVLNDKIIFSSNATTTLPLASLTKVMTGLTALSMAPANRLIYLNPTSIEDGYDIGLKKEQVWRLDELLKYTLVFSSNDGAQAIADNLGDRKSFVERMNEIAKELNLNLVFTNPSGVDEINIYGGQGTALDVAKLFVIAYQKMPNVFDATTHIRAKVKMETGFLSGVPNTNQDVESIVGLEASKTGFTNEAGGNLVIMFDAALGRPVVIVVLGSTKEERFTDVKKLYEATKEAIK